MPVGWFDAFRDEGGPTWYGDNRTSVLLDTGTLIIATLFGVLFLTFLIIFPGVRRDRASSFITVTLNLITGAVILISLYHPCWQMGRVRILAPYRSFSAERVDAILGVKIGLQTLNITLHGEVVGKDHSHFAYNERFQFNEVRSMQDELHRGLGRGLPYPILSIIQYLSIDQTEFSWGRHYRLAGYYTACLLWLCFAIWLLGLMMVCFVPYMYSRCLTSLGAMMCLTGCIYALATPVGLQIPFPTFWDTSHQLIPRFNWCFWIVFVNGAACLSIGLATRVFEMKKWYHFATFLQVDLHDLCESAESNILDDGGPLDPYSDSDRDSTRSTSSRYTTRRIRQPRNKTFSSSGYMQDHAAGQTAESSKGTASNKCYGPVTSDASNVDISPHKQQAVPNQQYRSELKMTPHCSTSGHCSSGTSTKPETMGSRRSRPTTTKKQTSVERSRSRARRKSLATEILTRHSNSLSPSRRHSIHPLSPIRLV